MIFTAVGLLVGSEALGLIDGPAGRGNGQAARPKRRLLSSSSRMPRGSTCAPLRGELSVPLRLLGIGLPLTLLAGFLVALFVFPQLSWSEALLLAVILAPTDAALGQAVVTLTRLPSRVRQGLNVESGLNDGICVPLFWIVLAIAQAESGAIGDGAAVRLVLEQIGYGILAGVVAGIAAALVVVVAGSAGTSVAPGSRSCRWPGPASLSESQIRSAAPGSSPRLLEVLSSAPSGDGTAARSGI
jgi:NhaP-type Na+/H+ and K+/H+ antiporter